MGPNEFRRLHAACLDRARHPRSLAHNGEEWVELADNVAQSPPSPRKLARSKPNAD
jgi:hypothetical protein